MQTTYTPDRIEARLFAHDIGTYETAKKSNHSARPIPQAFVDEIEAGTVTSEALSEIGRAWPVYRYLTCLTVHGSFPEIARQRIGSYKNIRQNQNGSLEILWTAIDLAKKRRIGNDLKAAGCEVRYCENSSETYFEACKGIADAQAWNETLARYQTIAANVQAVGAAHLRASIWKRASWLGVTLELRVTALAIEEGAVEPLTIALSGYADRAALDAAIAAKAEADRAQRERWERESKEADERRAAERAPLLEKAKVDFAICSAWTEKLQPTSDAVPVPGTTYYKAFANQSEAVAFVKSLTVEKSAFGRLKAAERRHYVKDGAVDQVGEPIAHYYGKGAKAELPADLCKRLKFPGSEHKWKTK